MMKKKIALLVMCSATLLFTACGGNTTKQTSGNDTPTEEVAQAEVKAMEVDQLLADAAALEGKQVEVEGICTHICKHGGRKLFLMGSSDKKVIQVVAGEEIGAFTEECVNSLVRIKGTLKEDRMDEAKLQEMEQQIVLQTAPKHGDSEAGCASEMKARGEGQAQTMQQRVDAMRRRIADRKAKEGKEYLSFYHIDGLSYEILK